MSAEDQCIAQLSLLLKNILGLDEESAQTIGAYVFTSAKDNNTIQNIRSIFNEDDIDLTEQQIKEIHSIISKFNSSKILSMLTTQTKQDDGVKKDLANGEVSKSHRQSLDDYSSQSNYYTTTGTSSLSSSILSGNNRERNRDYYPPPPPPPPPSGGSGGGEGVSGIAIKSLDKVLKVGGKRVRSSSQERWAKQQMISGNQGTNSFSTKAIQREDLSDDDDDADVDLTDVEPAFMKGMAGGIGLLSQFPEQVKLVQIPDGSMQKAAQAQQALAKERRELRQQMLAESGDAIPQNLHKGWVDPLSTSQTRHLAVDLKSIALAGADDRSREDASNQQDVSSMLDSVVTYGKVTTKSIKEQREELPVFQLRQQFIDAIASHQTLVVVGETGSGKTTQMAQYLYEEGYGANGIICCTQPRRVAATSVAQRVSEEVGCELGTVVGYSVRFDEVTSPETKIKFMTDGMLLREILLDPKLERYSVIIIDEAHERSVNTDILLALVKAAAKARPDLKFIVTSATLDAERFATYLGGCPIFSIPGRSYPITVLYSTETQGDYLEEALETVLSIHLERPPGDILVFLTGKEEIDSAVDTLKERVKNLGPSVPPLDVYPVYSSLPNEIQSKIFEPTPVGRRKCVLSTNIAEASITIDGIIYVVDTGFCKLKVYDSKIGMESLQVTPISQAQAKQRAGRAGRTRAGYCYRLYTEMAYHHEMTPTAVPELQRCDLAGVLLLLKAMGVNDLLNFDFIDPPTTSSMLSALQRLYWLGAVDSDGVLTNVGSRLAMMPVAPDLGKMLLVAADLGCVEEVATVVAMVSGEDIWTRPKNEQAQADRQRAALALREGDHPTLVRVFKKWEEAGKTNQWCVRHFVSSRAMNTAAKVRQQLLRTLAKMRIELSSCGDNWGLISRAVTAGLFMNAAKKEHVSVVGQVGSTPSYKTLTHGNTAFLHPASSLYTQMPQYIVYQKMLFTTKEYLHTATVIHPQWLIQLAPHLFTARSQKGPNDSGPRIRERLQPLSDRFNQPDAWRLGKRKG